LGIQKEKITFPIRLHSYFIHGVKQTKEAAPIYAGAASLQKQYPED
jgi:hypothetical protein